LEEEGISYHALDMDPDRVQEAQMAGANVSYGDAARRESLTAAGINRAAAGRHVFQHCLGIKNSALRE
jgi:CPA2 family monovalent cation:H+ antiporter-2